MAGHGLAGRGMARRGEERGNLPPLNNMTIEELRDKCLVVVSGQTVTPTYPCITLTIPAKKHWRTRCPERTQFAHGLWATIYCWVDAERVMVDLPCFDLLAWFVANGYLKIIPNEMDVALMNR